MHGDPTDNLAVSFDDPAVPGQPRTVKASAAGHSRLEVATPVVAPSR